MPLKMLIGRGAKVSDVDLDYVAKMERAIAQKYGRDTIKNPKSGWDEDKEKLYLRELEEKEQKRAKLEQELEKVEIGGFFVSKKLLNRKIVTNCPVCSKKMNNVMDDIYLNKYECCESCYIKHVENREERWSNGWRPNIGEK